MFKYEGEEFHGLEKRKIAIVLNLKLASLCRGDEGQYKVLLWHH